MRNQFKLRNGLFVLLCLFLANCAAEQWHGVESALGQCLTEQCEQQQAQYRASAIAANDDAICRNYGASPGTPVYVQCRMNLDNQRAAADTTQRAVITQYLLNRR